MCLTITPRYGCGHKDQAWLLYCNPTRKICGRKHPPLEVCHGKDVQKQDWNVFEPRCPRCERRFRAGRDKQLKRMTRISSAPPLGPSSTSTTPTMPPLTATATVPAVPPASKRRRAGSIFDGLKDLLRIDSALSLNSNSSSSRSARRAAACAAATLAATAHDSASLADSDKASSDDADSLQMLELHRALPSVSVDGETGFARGLLLDGAWSSSSLDSLPCSPRTSMAPTSVVQD